MKCRLDTDKWEDLGVEYVVHSYDYDPGVSSAVVLELEAPDGTMLTKVVAWHQIDWIEDNES